MTFYELMTHKFVQTLLCILLAIFLVNNTKLVQVTDIKLQNPFTLLKAKLRHIKILSIGIRHHQTVSGSSAVPTGAGERLYREEAEAK